MTTAIGSCYQHFVESHLGEFAVHWVVSVSVNVSWSSGMLGMVSWNAISFEECGFLGGIQFRGDITHVSKSGSMQIFPGTYRMNILVDLRAINYEPCDISHVFSFSISSVRTCLIAYRGDIDIHNFTSE